MKYSQKEIADARQMLDKFVKPGDTIYTVLRHVSRSGMMRRIDLYAINEGQPQYLSGWAAVILGERRPNTNGSGDGIRVDGCGMDMGFDLVYRLSVMLYCPDKYDHDAAYALKQRWM